MNNKIGGWVFWDLNKCMQAPHRIHQFNRNISIKHIINANFKVSLTEYTYLASVYCISLFDVLWIRHRKTCLSGW